MVKTVRALLLWFEASSELHVDMSKSVLYKVNEVECWNEIIHNWGCKEGKLPDTYLGLPLASKYKHT